MREPNKHQMLLLEQIMDATDVAGMLAGMSQIAFEKSEHIQTNWQDKNLAGLWYQTGRALEKFSQRIRV